MKLSYSKYHRFHRVLSLNLQFPEDSGETKEHVETMTILRYAYKTYRLFCVPVVIFRGFIVFYQLCSNVEGDVRPGRVSNKSHRVVIYLMDLLSFIFNAAHA